MGRKAFVWFAGLVFLGALGVAATRAAVQVPTGPSLTPAGPETHVYNLSRPDPSFIEGQPLLGVRIALEMLKPGVWAVLKDAPFAGNPTMGPCQESFLIMVMDDDVDHARADLESYDHGSLKWLKSCQSVDHWSRHKLFRLAWERRELYERVFATGILDDGLVDGAEAMILGQRLNWELIALSNPNDPVVVSTLDELAHIRDCRVLTVGQADGANVRCRYDRMGVDLPIETFMGVMGGLVLLQSVDPAAHGVIERYTTEIGYSAEGAPRTLASAWSPGDGLGWTTFYPPSAAWAKSPAGWALILYHEALHLRQQIDDLRLPEGVADPWHVEVYRAELELARHIGPEYTRDIENRLQCALTGAYSDGRVCSDPR